MRLYDSVEMCRLDAEEAKIQIQIETLELERMRIGIEKLKLEAEEHERRTAQAVMIEEDREKSAAHRAKYRAEKAAARD